MSCHTSQSIEDFIDVWYRLLSMYLPNVIYEHCNFRPVMSLFDPNKLYLFHETV